MNNRNCFLILAVLLTASFFSCKNSAELAYGTNKRIKSSPDEYFNPFKTNNIDIEKIFFTKSDSINNASFKFNYLKTFMGKSKYYYFGTFNKKNGKTYFKTIYNIDYGCNEALESLKRENEYPFIVDNEVGKLFDKYKFTNTRNKSLQFSDKKVVILIYSHSAGSLFFKDTKKIINFVNTNKEFEYIIINLNFYDFENQKLFN